MHGHRSGRLLLHQDFHPAGAQPKQSNFPGGEECRQCQQQSQQNRPHHETGMGVAGIEPALGEL